MKFADTTPHFSWHSLKEALTNGEHNCKILVEWFHDNFMTLNAEICHLLGPHKNELMFAKIGDATI